MSNTVKSLQPASSSTPNPCVTTTTDSTSTRSTNTTVTSTTNTTTTTSSTATTAANTATNDLADILKDYQCPFEADPELLCSYYETHTEGGVCPFGHKLTAFTGGIELIELPSYLCIAHLIEDCINPLTEGQVSRLVRCADGLHLTGGELVDGQRLQEMLASEILDADARQKERQQEVELIIHSFDQQDPPDSSAPPSADVTSTTTPDDCCSICRTDFTSSVGVFGLLDSCDHAFCAGCILTWHNSQRRCPNCRVDFRRVLLWPRPTLPAQWSVQHKAALFELQSRCVSASAGQTVRLDDLQEMMERLMTAD